MAGPLTFIDVDDRTIAYLTVGGRHTEDLRRWCPGSPDWCNAHLWRNLSGRYRVIRALTSDVRMDGRGFVILDMRARRIVSLFVYAPGAGGARHPASGHMRPQGAVGQLVAAVGPFRFRTHLRLAA